MVRLLAVSLVLNLFLLFSKDVEAFGAFSNNGLAGGGGGGVFRHHQKKGGGSATTPTTTLNALFRRKKSVVEDDLEDNLVVNVTPPDIDSVTKKKKNNNKKKKQTKKPPRIRKKFVDDAAICVVGGGLGGLAAALTASESLDSEGRPGSDKIVLLEASETLGGRLQSDKTDDGFIFDRGFAVFIDAFPAVQKVLDLDALKLQKFLPGALVKLGGYGNSPEGGLALVTDPLRMPEKTFEALFSPVGSLADKIKLLPLIFHVKERTVDELFEEEEIDTLTALKVRYGFSENILDRFFRPFLEGIYLSPLTEQSSRMFTFIFKMFSEGSAALPQGGMGSVACQLADKAKDAGVNLRLGKVVTSISRYSGDENKENEDDGFFLVQTSDGKAVQAKSVIVATDGLLAQKLISQIDGLQGVANLPEQPQCSVGCLYYTFDGIAPVEEPILILNGVGTTRGTPENPVNNVCFPSVVNRGYAPEGKHVCSVTVLRDAMEYYQGTEEDLDAVVRDQLSSWFPAFSDDILHKWHLRKIYNIPNAQPSQLYGPYPANVNKGRKCNKFRGFDLPGGLFVCGDHIATASYNGAIESGIKAGNAAATRIIQQREG